MEVTVNDSAMTLPDQSTLSALVERLRLPDRGVAAAIGGRVVPRAQWASTLLKHGDNVVVITAVSGG